MSEPFWIAAHTKANGERLALEHIRRQSFTAYCPMIERTRRHARRQDIVIRPLFPGYVFIQLGSLRESWRPLLSTRGIRTLVKFGDKLGILPAGFVEELKTCEMSGQLHKLTVPAFKPGDRITIADGVFKNLIAEVVSAPEKDRVWLLLEFMGQQVSVSQKLSSLIPA